MIIVLSLFGIADAGYISYEQVNNLIPPCGPGFDCGGVLTSQYAKIGPFPLSYYGLLYYITVLILSTLHYIEFDVQNISLFKKGLLRHTKIIDLLLLVTTFGFFFSIYLVFLMGVVIQAWCSYCLLSAGTSLLLFITVQTYHSKFTGHSSLLGKHIVLTTFYGLYQVFGKPLFFLFDPELVHNRITSLGKLLGSTNLTRFKTRWLLQFKHPILERRLDGILFPNPVGLSAGFDYNGELTQILSDVGFGWHTIGTVTYLPYGGNPKPRLGRFPRSKALLVNKGLKSIGAKEIIKKLTRLTFRIPVGISIASTNTYFKDDHEQIMDILKCFLEFEHSALKHSYYELNISCPNTFGGEPFTTPNRLEVLLSAIDHLSISRPIYVKMPIDQSEAETVDLLNVIASHSPKGVIFGNLTKDKNNPAVDPEDREVWKNKKGNVSGKPTFERSNKLISLTKKQFKNRFTIVGTGGIFTAADAQEKINRGADLVQLITGMIYEGPSAIGQINLGLTHNLLDSRTK